MLRLKALAQMRDAMVAHNAPITSYFCSAIPLVLASLPTPGAGVLAPF
ncbi:hypothetical protein [Niastella vici]|nr:hypothetical protein [Niastella vici]